MKGIEKVKTVTPYTICIYLIVLKSVEKHLEHIPSLHVFCRILYSRNPMSFFQSEEDVITLGVARLCLSVVCSGAGDHQHRV